MTEKSSLKTWHAVSVVVLLGLFIAILPGAVYASPKRGDAPHCQAECNAEHGEALKQLIDDYNRTGNKAEFQERLDHAVKVYAHCIENCKALMPVK